MRESLFDSTENVGLRWTDEASLREGFCLFVPGGAQPVSRARSSAQDVVSVGVFDTRGEEQPTLLRSAHVPLRIRRNSAVLTQLRALAQSALHTSKSDRERGLLLEPTPLEYPRRPAGDDTPIARLRGAKQRATRALSSARQAVRPYALFDRWRIGVSRCEIAEYLDPAARPTIDWLHFDDPYVYAADPFALPRAALGESGDGIRIFFEYFDYRAPVGDIRSVTWSEREGFGLPRAELREAHHLSYPTLITSEDRVLLMPESSEAGGIAVYARDAGVWEPAGSALAGFPAVDPNIIEFDGHWWLFATDGAVEPAHALHVFVGDSPLGPWTPHPGNPVVCDPRWGRGAGSLFVHAGRLYRPTQDGTRTYGGAVVLTEITKLSATGYAQRPIARVTAAQLGGGEGVHTLSACGPYTLVDAKDQVPLPLASLGAIYPLLTRPVHRR